MLHLALIYKADRCFEIILKKLQDPNVNIQIDFSQLFARTLTVYNFQHRKDPKEPKINGDIFKMIIEIIYKKIGINCDSIMSDKIQILSKIDKDTNCDSIKENEE